MRYGGTDAGCSSCFYISDVSLLVQLLSSKSTQVRELGQVVTCVTDILEVGEKTTVA